MSDINQPAKDVAEVDIGGAEVRDLGPVQDSLALLTDTEVAYVTSYKTAPKVADVSPNISGGRQLILDDYLFSPNVMVRNEDTFWILGGLEDEQADSRPVSSAGAALDPDKQFVYFVQDQGIGIFDLLLYPKDSPPVIECGDSSFCTIPELTKPAFITWTRAAPAAMP